MKQEIIVGKRESSNFFRKMGTYLNIDSGEYKTYEKSFGFESGNWKKLPHIDYILIFKPLYAKCESCSLEDFDKDSVYQLSFVYNKNQKIIIHETSAKDEIFRLASRLSVFFKIKIKDAATDRRTPVWLNI